MTTRRGLTMMMKTQIYQNNYFPKTGTVWPKVSNVNHS